jgi:hypothetical protein
MGKTSKEEFIMEFLRKNLQQRLQPTYLWLAAKFFLDFVPAECLGNSTLPVGTSAPFSAAVSSCLL